MSKGTLRADELKVSKIDVDFLTNPVKVRVLLAFVDTSTGHTIAWANGDGGMWSTETKQKLRELCDSMEEDAARQLLSEHSSVPAKSSPAKTPVGGIGEHLGDEAPDAPQL